MSGSVPLKIPVDKLSPFLTCPICMSLIRQTTITTCGHRFCNECIQECINRQHKCPCCLTSLGKRQTIKDIQFDQLIETFKHEKDICEETYFEELIHSHEQTAEGSDKSGSDLKQDLSPVELVLRKHLKASLSHHECYFRDLTLSFKKQLKSLELECDSQVANIDSQDLLKQDKVQQQQKIKEAYWKEVNRLNEELSKCGREVADSYDKYLSNHLPDLSVLPVTVTLKLLGGSHDVTINDVNLKPENSTRDLKSLILDQCEKDNDRVLHLGDDIKFIYFGPFSKRSLVEMVNIASNITETSSASYPDIFILPEGSRPILEYLAKPGCLIVLYGQIQFESDIPKQCFSQTFNKDNMERVDYFKCGDCSLKWICRPCMESCHIDHNVVPYILQHQPTWACCYCPKKKKCNILEV